MRTNLNTVIVRGVLSRAAERRALASGTTTVSLEVTTHTPAGAATVPVAWPDAPPGVDALEVGTEVVVTGVVRRRFFRAGGTTQSRTEVVADVVVAATDRRARRVIERAVASLGC